MKRIYLLILFFLGFKSGFAQADQIRINEIIAKNTNGDTSEFGEHGDWIEFYNNSSITVNMAGLLVTDDPNFRNKYRIPSGLSITSIPPHGFIRCWADDSITTVSTTQIHLPFKLSSSGEFVGLYLPSDSSFIDSVRFGAQTADTSFARCPDGTGVFSIAAAVTPQASNCSPPSGISRLEDYLPVFVYPVPCSDKLQLQLNLPEELNYEIIDLLGRKMINGSLNGIQNTINVSDLAPGQYWILLNDQYTFRKLSFIKQ